MVFSISWAQTDEVVVIDSEYTQKSIVLEQLPQSTTVIEVGHSENPWKTVRHFLEDNTTVKTIHLFADTSNNALQLGGIAYD